MRSKIVYNMVNAREELAFEDSKNPGKFLIPGGCTEVAPPEFDRGTHICEFVEGRWRLRVYLKSGESPRLSLV